MIEKLNELLSTTEKWVIEDKDGGVHELSEGVAGKPKKIDPKSEIFDLLHINPKYITFENLQKLHLVFNDTIQVVYESASSSVCKKFDHYLDTGEVEVKEKRKRGPNKIKKEAKGEGKEN